MNRQLRPRRVWPVVQLVAGVALVAGAVGVATVDAVPNADHPVQNAAAAPVGLGASPERPTRPSESPFRLLIPTINVDAPIVGVDIDDEGVLGIPNDPFEIGWWAGGPMPGSGRGTSILAGHVNTARRGPGALKEIEALEAGGTVVIEGWGAPITFEVDSVEQHPRSALPPTAFDQRIAGRLAIVSCSDLDEETGTYRNNIIVYAHRVEGPAARADLASS